MGTEQEVLQLDMIVSGLDDLASLVAAQDKASTSTDRLRDAQGKFVAAGGASGASSGGKTVKQQAQDIYDFADAYEVLGEEMKGVFTTAQQVGQAQASIANTIIPNGTDAQLAKTAGGLDSVGKAGEKAKGGVAGFGQSALQAGRVVQDFAQGGIGGILNNIEGLTMALGLGSGLAGILTIAGVGVLTFKKQLLELWETFAGGPEKAQGFIDKVKDLESTVKELGEKQGVTIIDLANLDNARRKLEDLKAAQAAFNALKNAQTNLQEKVGKAVKDVVIEESGGSDEESGAANLAKLMEAAQRRQGTFGKIGANAGLNQEKDAREKRLKEDKADFESGASSPEQAEFLLRRMQADEDRIKTLATQIADNARKANEETIGRAGRGIDSARKEIAGLYDANPETFTTGAGVAAPVGAGFRGKLALAGPANIKAAEEQDRATKASVESMKEQAEQAKKADAAKKATQAALDKQNADDLASPDAKAHEAMLKEKGYVDEFGRKIGQEGFDEDSALKVMRKAQAVKKAPGNGPLPPMATDDRARKVADARQREALATEIHQDSGGGFSPDQSRQIAGRAMHMAKQNGDLLGSVAMAMAEVQATMAGFGAKMQHIERKIEGVRQGNRQVNRRMNEQQPSALASGGYP